MGHSPLLLWVAIYISLHSLMIIPVMVLSSSFMKSLTLWRLSFKSKVELQQGNKVVHSDKGGEYYGRYDEIGCNLGSFAKYL